MLSPFQTLYEPKHGIDVPLPPALAQSYGQLEFPDHAGRPYVISNFVTTLDGVTTLGIPGRESGKEISGSNQHDRMVMGLLRAVADAVVVGAGTLRVVPHSLWTAEYIDPSLSDEYRNIRQTLKKPGSPLNVIVTGSGKIDSSLPVFQSGKVPALIVTTLEGAFKISKQSLPPSTQLIKVTSHPRISAQEIIDAVANACHTANPLILVEGGPLLMSDMFAARLIDEQFLTLAPQVAGRDESTRRPGLVDGRLFAPDSPVWGTLAGVKRAGDHLFLRYKFETKYAT